MGGTQNTRDRSMRQYRDPRSTGAPTLGETKYRSWGQKQKLVLILFDIRGIDVVEVEPWTWTWRRRATSSMSYQRTCVR